MVARRLDVTDFAHWQLLVILGLLAAPGVLPLLEQMDGLLERPGLNGLDAWIATGLRLSAGSRSRRLDFFRLQFPRPSGC